MPPKSLDHTVGIHALTNASGSFELVGLAAIRWRFFETSFVKSLGYVTLGGAVIALAGATIGTAA